MKTHIAAISRFARRGLVVGFALLLAAATATAERLSLSQLLARIEALEAVVDALPAALAPAVVPLNAAPGAVLSQTNHEDCVLIDVDERECDLATTVLISVPPGSRTLTAFTLAELGGGQGPQNVAVELINADHPSGGEIDGTLTIETAPYSFELQPDRPVMVAQNDAGYQGDLRVRMALISDSLVAVTVPATDQVRGTISASKGYIASAVFRPSASNPREAQIEARVTNEGDIWANYLVIVSGCSENIDVGTPFHILWLDPVPTVQRPVLFDVTTDTGFAPGNSCEIDLRSPSGKVYDRKSVTF